MAPVYPPVTSQSLPPTRNETDGTTAEQNNAIDRTTSFREPLVANSIRLQIEIRNTYDSATRCSIFIRSDRGRPDRKVEGPGEQGTCNIDIRYPRHSTVRGSCGIVAGSLRNSLRQHGHTVRDVWIP